MARLSKTHRFTIFEDTGIPTPEPAEKDKFEEIDTSSGGDVINQDVHNEQLDITSENGDDVHQTSEPSKPQGDASDDADDERRESTITATSISSFPESTWQTENDAALPTQQPYAPPIIRPSFRRPQSVQRMQMGSPPSFGTRSPRDSILNYYRSRTGTPRSVKSANANGSPRWQRKQSINSEGLQETEQQQYPLILLHITLIPLNLPWSAESMREILPSQVLDNLQLLRSKVTDTVLTRGVLIPHPREEFELLEERLLEALELKEERITKCGHFRNRVSSRSDTSREDSGRDSDSGIGSMDEANGELCAICRRYIQGPKSGVGDKTRRWTLKVFAANGLMRSSAWSAAWPEMERVDVEILPWISDETRQKLDKRTAEEELEEHERLEDEEARIKELVEEQVRVAYEERKRVGDAELRALPQQNTMQLQLARPTANSSKVEIFSPGRDIESPTGAPPADLPHIYKPSQIPLPVLLRNYVYLLAQDRRNIVIFLLSILVLFYAARPMPVPKRALVLDADRVSTQHEPTFSRLATVVNSSIKAPDRSEEPVTDESSTREDFTVEMLIEERQGDTADDKEGQYDSSQLYMDTEFAEQDFEIEMD